MLLTTINHLLCRQQPRNTSPINDGYVKGVVTGIGLTLSTSLIVSTVKNVGLYITKENAQYCAVKGFAMLIELQRQLQIYNASCIPESPGSNLSVCNSVLLPKPMNTSCSDVTTAGVVDYLPALGAAFGLVTFSFFIGRSILTSYDQRKEQIAERWYLFNSTGGKSPYNLYDGVISESETLSAYEFTSSDSQDKPVAPET